jgi:hypothetical protein
MDNPAPDPLPLTNEGTEGLPAPAPEPPQPEPTPVDPVQEQLAALEKQNTDLQHRLTQQGRKLKEIEQPPASQNTTTEEFDWNNPKGSIKETVSEVFSEYEARQNQQREMDSLYVDKAQELGIPVSQLREYTQALLESSKDQGDLMNTVARMYQADHAEKAITEATNATKQTLERNARGVMSEGGPTQPGEVTKNPRDMANDELDAFVKGKYGVADWEG